MLNDRLRQPIPVVRSFALSDMSAPGSHVGEYYPSPRRPAKRDCIRNHYLTQPAATG